MVTEVCSEMEHLSLEWMLLLYLHSALFTYTCINKCVLMTNKTPTPNFSATNVSFIYLAQDNVDNSPYASVTKECNGGDLRHFRSSLASFVRQICLNASNRIATTLCLFKDKTKHTFWAFVLISCQGMHHIFNKNSVSLLLMEL